MKSAAIAKVIPGITLTVCAFGLVFWITSNRRAIDVSVREPGQEQQVMGQGQQPVSGPAAPVAAVPSAPVSAPLEQGQAAQAPVRTIAGEWPRFRGANFDNISTEAVPLAAKWAAGYPPLLWGLDVGEGYAGAAVSASRVYVLDYDRQAQADVLRCLALADGKELWHVSYPVVVKRNHGMSRTVPAVWGKYVVTLGPKCHVMCADATTGQVYWFKDLVREYRTDVPPWYAGQVSLDRPGQGDYRARRDGSHGRHRLRHG